MLRLKWPFFNTCSMHISFFLSQWCKKSILSCTVRNNAKIFMCGKYHISEVVPNSHSWSVKNISGQKFHLSAHKVKSRKDKQFFPKHSSCRMSALGGITCGSRITYYSLMILIAYAFKGHVHAFTGRMKVLSHSSCRTSAIFKCFCPLIMLLSSWYFWTFL